MGIDLKRRTRTTRERLSNIRTYSEIKELQMSITIFPNLEIQFEGKSYFLTFATETMQVLKSQGLREVITCRIAQSEPLRFYAGMTVRNPKDPIADDYFPHAKVALKRALKALWYDQTEGVEGIDDVKHHCFSCMYSHFRYDLLHHKLEFEKQAAIQEIAKLADEHPFVNSDWMKSIKSPELRQEIQNALKHGSVIVAVDEPGMDEVQIRSIVRNEMRDLFRAD
jgi:hypothetical protein